VQNEEITGQDLNAKNGTNLWHRPSVTVRNIMVETINLWRWWF